MEETERFIRLRDGTIYGYSELLAKRRDVTVVDGWAAAAWFKSLGVENEVTARYAGAIPAERAGPVLPPSAARRENRNVAKERQREERETKMLERRRKLAILNTPPEDAIPSMTITEQVKELLGDGQDGL